MNNISSHTTNEYDNASGTNPSLITAGLPSGSIMTSRLIQPSSTIEQNQAIDTQPISISNSLQNKNSQYTILTHRTISDTYLNLSRKDINDVMIALHTLAQYVQNDNDNEDQHLTMLYSKSTNHTLKGSTQTNNSSHHYHHPRYSKQRRQHSLSTDRWLNHHHIKHHLNLVEEFKHDLYNIKRKQKHRILRQLQYHQNYLNYHNLSNYPSYSSNAILYTSTCRSNTRSKPIYHWSQQRQSTTKIPSEDQYQQSIKQTFSSSISLSSYILDKLVYINQKEPISNIQMLPQQAHTLQILQNNHIHSFISIDSLNTKDIIIKPLKSHHLQKLNHDQISGMGDQLNSNKIDVSTQWSLQILTPESDISSKTQNEQNNSKLDLIHTNSTILTELSQSITTIATNNSTINIPSISLINNPCNNKLNTDINEIYLEKSSLTMNDQHELTKSETERFLTTLNIPTCKCSTTKLQIINTNIKHSSMDDNITCISLDNNSSIDSSSLLSNKKKTKQTSIKFALKRPHHHISKLSKNNPTIKRSRPHHRSQLYKTVDLKEDSSFDFFDIDTTFSDGYDRLFTDTTTSEKSS